MIPSDIDGLRSCSRPSSASLVPSMRFLADACLPRPHLRHENSEAFAAMFTAHPIGFIHSPFRETSAIPKGLGAKHDAEGVIELLREYEPGLADIEGFSHLFVLWEFDRADGFDLIAHPPTDEGRPHGVFATRSPRRPNPIGLTVVELLRPRWRVVARARRGHAGRDAGSRHQAVSVEHSGGEAAAGMAGGGGRTRRNRNRGRQ